MPIALCRWLWICLFALGAAGQAGAAPAERDGVEKPVVQQPVRLATPATVVNLQGRAYYWANPGATVAIDELLSGALDSQFRPWDEHVPSTGSRWLRLDLRNDSTATDWFLAIDKNLYSVMELHYRSGATTYSQRAGIQVPRRQWPVDFRAPALPVTLPPGAEVQLYIRLQSVLSLSWTPYLISARQFVTTTHQLALWPLLTIGIYLGISAYALMLALVTGEWRGTLAFSGLMVCSALMILSVDGFIVIESLMAGLPPTSLMFLAALASRLLLLQFARDIFRTRQRYPRFDALLLGLLAVGLLLPLLWFGDAPVPAPRLFIVFSMLVLLTLLVFCGYSLVRGAAADRGLLLGFGSFLLLMLWFLAAQLWPALHAGLPANALEIALAMQAATFSLLLAQRLRDYRRHNTRLQTRNAVAEAENRAKSQLLAMMSHEIRTPMNGVLGMAELLQHTDLNDTQRHFTNTILNSGKTLLTVINDILDFSKADVQKLTLQEEPFNLAELIEEVAMPFRASSSAPVQLLASVAPDTPIYLLGDPVRLTQVLTNLLSNAFKFTSAGVITLRVSAGQPPPAQDAQRVQLWVEVQDCGIGISAEGLAQLFKPFSQLDHGVRRRFGGTGLGLVICRKLVQLMDGDIRVESQLGQGTTFSFDVWLQRDPQPLVRNGLTDLRGLRLLAVDDQPDYLQVLAEQARALGMEVDTCSDPGRMRALLATGPRPDIISIDGELGGSSGLEVGASLNDLAAIAGVPRILLTASCNPVDSGRLQAAGFCKAFTKPVSKQELQRMLSQVLNCDPVVAPLPAPTAYRAPAGLRVLVAEDNVTNRQVIDAMLKKLGVQAQLTHNGLEAVTAVLAAAQPWHLILMDCEMPELDGYAAARRIRAHEAGKGQPRVLIVALSAHALDEHRAHSQAAGMDAHLTKPINLQVLRELLQQLQID